MSYLFKEPFIGVVGIMGGITVKNEGPNISPNPLITGADGRD